MSTKNDMSLLDAFNHLTRHSVCNSFLTEKFKNSSDASSMITYVYLSPYFMALFNKNPALAVAGTASLVGLFGAKAVYKRLANQAPLNPLLNVMSKIDMPLFISSHIYLLQSSIRDLMELKSGIEPLLIMYSSFSLWEAYKGIKDVGKPGVVSNNDDYKLLPPPSNDLES
jgi:hypothetical protein